MKICEISDNLFELEFTVDLPFEQVIAQLKLTENEDIEELRLLWNQTIELAVPKAMYRICGVNEIKDDLVNVEGTVFKSQVLAGNLTDIHRIFAYVITCGQEVEEWSRAESDFLVAMWLDVIKQIILNDATAQFMAHIKKLLGTEKISAMNPGSGEADVWPIAQQRELFELIGDVEAHIGVRLAESYLMFPTKTVSGVLYPSEVDFITCSLCKREHCVGRRAPYAGVEA